jgi:hypothetical protein
MLVEALDVPSSSSTGLSLLHAIEAVDVRPSNTAAAVRTVRPFGFTSEVPQ